MKCERKYNIMRNKAINIEEGKIHFYTIEETHKSRANNV